MPIRTKRWNDPVEANDGLRVLICRYRPRALPKKDENWQRWHKELGPSKELHADFYGKGGKKAITWDEYRRRYLKEMKEERPQELIAELADLVAQGKPITLLCSSACKDELRCHRTLLRELIEKEAARRAGEG